MKERGMIFNAEMVRAVMEGRKVQTRRIIQSPAKNMQANGQKVIDYREPGDKWYGEHVFSMRNQSGIWCDYTKEQFLAKCPFGAVGDRLWVRETWQCTSFETNEYGHVEGVDYMRQISVIKPNSPAWGVSYKADCFESDDANERGFPWRPSIHMPRWASRITLEITGVRVERLNSISGEDARSEGFAYEGSHVLGDIDEFSRVWTSIYGEESWQANPWVWVIDFKRVEGGTDD